MPMLLLLRRQVFSRYDIKVTSSRLFDGPFFFDPNGMSSQFIRIVDDTYMTSRGQLLHRRRL